MTSISDIEPPADRTKSHRSLRLRLGDDGGSEAEILKKEKELSKERVNGNTVEVDKLVKELDKMYETWILDMEKRERCAPEKEKHVFSRELQRIRKNRCRHTE